MLFGDVVEDQLTGSDSTALASYGPTPATYPSATTAPYFGPDVDPGTGNYVSPGAAVLSQDAASAAANQWWGAGIANAVSRALGTGVGAAIQNLFKPTPAPIVKPASSNNTLLVVGGLGVAAVAAVLLLRRRA